MTQPALRALSWPGMWLQNAEHPCFSSCFRGGLVLESKAGLVLVSLQVTVWLGSRKRLGEGENRRACRAGAPSSDTRQGPAPAGTSNAKSDRRRVGPRSPQGGGRAAGNGGGSRLERPQARTPDRGAGVTPGHPHRRPRGFTCSRAGTIPHNVLDSGTDPGVVRAAVRLTNHLAHLNRASLDHLKTLA